ncbi:phosphatidate cytidylyltransferase [Candidatus Saccharibacteria bacterium]|nr:phosphatidate cytidylyltransferase [Candidatus Saccharibacteria bacterium]
MDKSKKRNLLTRAISGVLIAAVVVPAYFIKGGAYFHIVIRFAIMMSILEFITIVGESHFIPMRPVEYSVTGLVFIELVACIIGIGKLPVELVGGLVFVCVATDAFAYLLGSFYGGVVFKKRPFPTTSPNKTYEGLFFGLAFGIIAAHFWTAYMESVGTPVSFFRLAIAAPLAVFGDILESRFKRLYDVKDANDFVVQIPVVGWLEAPLGGRDGHGGYLDRIDSLLFVIMLELLIP